ncbi:hypothetical protein A2U01_0094404, partial [Trifolium medium]|nr:hypothetical protein [Trifolium medium]
MKVHLPPTIKQPKPGLKIQTRPLWDTGPCHKGQREAQMRRL